MSERRRSPTGGRFAARGSAGWLALVLGNLALFLASTAWLADGSLCDPQLAAGAVAAASLFLVLAYARPLARAGSASPDPAKPEADDRAGLPSDGCSRRARPPVRDRSPARRRPMPSG